MKFHNKIISAGAAAAACVALSTGGVGRASASAAAPQAALVNAAGTSHASAIPGTQLWVERYNHGNGIDAATSVAVSPDGKMVYATGYSFGGTFSDVYDYATVAYNAVTGHQQWVERYNDPSSGDDQAHSVAVSPDGSTVFVTGYSQGTAGSYDYATVAYSAATGHQRWVMRYKCDPHVPPSLAVSPDGSTVFVTGSSFAATTGDDDYATAAYDAATGHQRWLKRYNSASGSSFAHSMAVSPDGSTVLVTGSSLGRNNGYDYATVAYNATTGAQRWVMRYNGATGGSRGANSVAVSPDGKTVFVTGSSYGGSATSYDDATVAYNATTGAQLWIKRYTGPGSGDDQAYSVAVGPDGHTAFVTGYSGSATIAGQVDYATVAYNAVTGHQQWVRFYAGPASGGIGTQAYSVAVSPSGSTVYVTGESGNDSAYATVAYNAVTGQQQWTKRYQGNGPNGGAAQAVAVSPTTGAVFVTGHSSGSGTGYDYATLAYQG